ncbi:MAG TPA: PsiF family protein [Burkholderiaceae bacterium]|jgi:hypothetical protein|nr:PsiF family protein [Burkholderiaceae bacterium]
MSSSFLRGLLAACAGVLLAHGAVQAASAPALAASSPVAKPVASSGQSGQRNKMKECNAEARQKDLHKAERRAFMKECLSKGGTA